MPLEGNAEMIVWRQAVDTELRLANQWEDGMDGIQSGKSR
jgi:DNA mismatch repair protein MutH